jgi:hypothetical protein
MNKIIASAGLAALGAASSLQAQYAPGLSPQERSKPWSISGTLRGFYDDNPTASIKADKQASWGMQLSPSLSVNLALDQTLIGFNYTYDMRWYEARPTHEADHHHYVSLKVNHAITERYKLDVSDVFNYGQEAELQGIVSNPTGTLRTEQNYIHNNGHLGFTAELTSELGLVAEYQNDFWDYDQDGNGSLSSSLDRVEHLFSVTARWQTAPNTVGLLGYQYGVVSHTSDDSLLAGFPPNVPPVFAPAADSRDANSHFVSVGAEQIFSSQFTGKARLGAQFTDYPNALANQDDSAISPYADASASWTYNPGSYLTLGVRHQRNQTDVAFVAGGGGTPVQDQESTGVYGVVNHRIAPNITGSVLGQYQYSSFRGGGAEGKVDMLGAVGVNLAYQFNAFVTAEAGYNYDRLDSDLVGRSFSRNRFYFGVRATY